MIEIGRLCVKLTGREAGKKCIIVENVDKNFVTIDGNVKRRKCNVSHIELLPEKLDIKSGASTDEVKKLFQDKGILDDKKAKVANKRARKGGDKPKKIRPRKKPETADAKDAKGKGKGKKAKMTEDEQIEAALAKV